MINSVYKHRFAFLKTGHCLDGSLSKPFTMIQRHQKDICSTAKRGTSFLSRIQSVRPPSCSFKCVAVHEVHEGPYYFVTISQNFCPYTFLSIHFPFQPPQCTKQCPQSVHGLLVKTTPQQSQVLFRTYWRSAAVRALQFS